jgi:hypothetical protein
MVAMRRKIDWRVCIIMTTKNREHNVLIRQDEQKNALARMDPHDDQGWIGKK